LNLQTGVEGCLLQDGQTLVGTLVWIVTDLPAKNARARF